MYQTDSSSHFLKIKALCKECQASAVGTMIEQPLKGKNSQLLWQAIAIWGTSHLKKRQVMGKFRENVGRQVHYTAVTMY